jgi:hypothetical protein
VQEAGEVFLGAGEARSLIEFIVNSFSHF